MVEPRGGGDPGEEGETAPGGRDQIDGDVDGDSCKVSRSSTAGGVAGILLRQRHVSQLWLATKAATFLSLYKESSKKKKRRGEKRKAS